MNDFDLTHPTTESTFPDTTAIVTTTTITTTSKLNDHNYYILDQIDVPNDQSSVDEVLEDLTTVLCNSDSTWSNCMVKSVTSKRDALSFSFQTDIRTTDSKDGTKIAYNSKFENADESVLSVFDEKIKNHRLMGEICEMKDGFDDCEEIIVDETNVGLIVGLTFFGLFIILGTGRKM